MIGNAIDKALVSLNHEECITIDDDMAGETGQVNMTMPSLTNMTQCDALKVEMAVTLSLLTGIIMVIFTYLNLLLALKLEKKFFFACMPWWLLLDDHIHVYICTCTCTCTVAVQILY